MQVKRWGQLDALRQQIGESRWLLCVDLEGKRSFQDILPSR